MFLNEEIKRRSCRGGRKSRNVAVSLSDLKRGKRRLETAGVMERRRVNYFPGHGKGKQHSDERATNLNRRETKGMGGYLGTNASRGNIGVIGGEEARQAGKGNNARPYERKDNPQQKLVKHLGSPILKLKGLQGFSGILLKIIL